MVIAHIEKVIKPSNVRRFPPCPYYERCGGCQLQHIDYHAQLEAKVGFVKESLERIGRIHWPHEIPIYYGDEFQYRLRTQLKQKRNGGGVSIGFYQAGSNEICEIESCMILSPALNGVIETLRSTPSVVRGDTGVESIRLISAENGVVAAYPEVGRIRSDNVEIATDGNRYLVGPTDFFQANRYLLSQLLEIVTGRERGIRAVDLYCGVGFFFNCTGTAV